MPNLRIIYNNVADTAATLTADSTAGTLVAANLLTDIKSETHRSVGTTVSYTLTWAAAVSLSGVVLPFCNLTAAATIRARVYTNVADPGAALDTTAVTACAAAALVPWGGVTGVNGWAYGGASCARVWFAPTSGKKLVIDISDAGNADGYIETARIVAGAYWSPALNPGYGTSIAPKSNTSHKRTDAGDLRTERRPTSRSLRLDLSVITAEADRATVYDILTGNGMSRPVYLSLFPEDAVGRVEQDHQIYGKASDSTLSHPSFGIFSAPLEVEQI